MYAPNSPSTYPDLLFAPFDPELYSTMTVGKTLAYTSVRFTNANDELVARGSHTKCVFKPLP